MTNIDKYGPVWSAPTKNMNSILQSESDINLRFAQILENGYFSQFTSYASPEFNQKLIDWLISMLSSECKIDIDSLPKEFSELDICPKQTLLEAGDRLLSPDFLRNLFYAHEIGKALIPKDSKNIKILEIGPGYGCLSRILKLIYPEAQIYLIDITESLASAEIYLKKSFPNAKIFNVDCAESSSFEDSDFVLIPTEFATDFLSINKVDFEMAINIWSFGEMLNSYVKEWLNLIQNVCKCQWFYTINSFMAPVTPDSIQRTELGDWLFNLDSYWSIENFCIDPIVHRCHLVTNFPKGVSILAKRINTDQQVQILQSNASSRLESVIAEDWIWCTVSDQSTNNPERPETTYRDIVKKLDIELISAKRLIQLTDYVGHFNIVSSMHGTFFKLWDNWRLNNCRTSASLLIAYLAMIGKTDLRFRCSKEEIFLLNRIPKVPLHNEYLLFLENEKTASSDLKEAMADEYTLGSLA